MLFVTNFASPEAETREFLRGPIFNITFGEQPQVQLHWRALLGDRCLLEISLSGFSGMLFEISLVAISRDKVAAVGDNYTLQPDRVGLPVFDRSLWKPEVLDPSSPPNYNDTFVDEELDFSLRLGRSAIALGIGVPRRITNVCQAGSVRIGLADDKTLCRIDVTELSLQDMKTVREAVSMTGGYLHRHGRRRRPV